MLNFFSKQILILVLIFASLQISYVNADNTKFEIAVKNIINNINDVEKLTSYQDRLIPYESKVKSSVLPRYRIMLKIINDRINYFDKKDYKSYIDYDKIVNNPNNADLTMLNNDDIKYIKENKNLFDKYTNLITWIENNKDYNKIYKINDLLFIFEDEQLVKNIIKNYVNDIEEWTDNRNKCESFNKERIIDNWLWLFLSETSSFSHSECWLSILYFKNKWNIENNIILNFDKFNLWSLGKLKIDYIDRTLSFNSNLGNIKNKITGKKYISWEKLTLNEFKDFIVSPLEIKDYKNNTVSWIDLWIKWTVKSLYKENIQK